MGFPSLAQGLQTVLGKRMKGGHSLVLPQVKLGSMETESTQQGEAVKEATENISLQGGKGRCFT